MRKFLASVGNAQLLANKNGKLEHIADIRTLTESTLSFSNTMEEVRAGQGAKLYGRFSHDSGMTVTLTDAMFDINYIALQIGATSDAETSAFYDDYDFEVATDVITPSKTVANIGKACGIAKPVIWVKEKGCDVANSEWVAIVSSSDEYSLVGTALAGKTKDKLCVRYFINKPEAHALTVKGNFIPAECILILTTQLFAGDANAPETGKPVGSITVKIPRFQLDGNFDLSMAMSSASTLSLSGTALAVDDGTCDGDGVYAEIVEVEDMTDFTKGLRMIVIDTDAAEAGKAPVVYGLYNDGHTAQLDINGQTTPTAAECPYLKSSAATFVKGTAMTVEVYENKNGTATVTESDSYTIPNV
mgnify:CR=1 FL=1